MPIFTLLTNVDQSKVTEALLHELSSTIAKMLDKPIQYISVVVEGGKKLTFGDDPKAPAGVAILKSIGSVGREVNTKYSEVFFEIIKKHLGIPGHRLFIEYIDIPATGIALNSETLNVLLGC